MRILNHSLDREGLHPGFRGHPRPSLRQSMGIHFMLHRPKLVFFENAHLLMSRRLAGALQSGHCCRCLKELCKQDLGRIFRSHWCGQVTTFYRSRENNSLRSSSCQRDLRSQYQRAPTTVWHRLAGTRWRPTYKSDGSKC